MKLFCINRIICKYISCREGNMRSVVLIRCVTVTRVSTFHDSENFRGPKDHVKDSEADFTNESTLGATDCFMRSITEPL